MDSSPDFRPLVILPSYNSGALLVPTAKAVLALGETVLVVLDGSTDESVAQIGELERHEPNLRVICLKTNQGKGGATLVAMEAALKEGFTHGVIMDADGQHPATAVTEFLALARREPAAMILGEPVFGEDAPIERVRGRRIGNWFCHLETLWGGVQDSLFGFRLYPLAPAVRVMKSISTARRFDFDTELVVRLFWAGLRPINRPVAVTYPPREAGGVTHFKYLRDNLLLVWTHFRLCLFLLPRLLRVWNLRTQWHSKNDT